MPERRMLLMWTFEDGPEDEPEEWDPRDVGLAWIVTFAGNERISSEEVAEGRSITLAEARRLAEREGYELTLFDETLIGFDGREAGEYNPGPADNWRQTRFLRDDITRPLSVEAGVWPTIIDGPWRDVPLLDGLPGGKQIGVTQDYDRTVMGPNAPLWQNLDRMKNRLDEQGADPAEIVLVAVGWCFRWDGKSPYPYPPDRWGYRVSGPDDMMEAEPAEPEKRWTLLGYDVADASLSSWLSNCYYTPDDSDREKWAPKLNDHHLFSDQDPAFAFVEVMNTRVPPDAMFHVYSLYRLP